MRVIILSLFFSIANLYSQSDKFFNFYIDNLESLSKVYNKDFIIGTAVSYNDLKNPKLSKLITKHYSSITAENEMKPEALLNNDGSFSWEKADAIMEFAKENDLMEIDEDYLYPGNENLIIMSNYFIIKLGCTFDLKW